MKRKHVITTFSLSIALGLGIFAGIALGNRGVKEAKAAVGQTYYLVGETKAGGASQIGWNTDANAHAVVDGGSEVVIEFEENDQFKFVLEGKWDGALGVADVLGPATGYISNNSSNDNITCKVGGAYKVKIKDSKVYFEHSETEYTDIYVRLHEFENTFVYAFDNTTNSGKTLEPLGKWPGTQVSNYTVGVNFAEDYSIGGGIAKMAVPYIRLTNTNIIINNGIPGEGGQQSGNQTLFKGNFYQEFGTAGDSNNGLCAAAVFDISKLVEGATDQSACKITANAANEVLTKHASVLSYSKVIKSTLYTWKDASKTEKQNFTFAEVIALLQEIAAGGNPSRKMQSNIIDNNYALIVIIASVTAISAVGLFFIIKRRKHN